MKIFGYTALKGYFARPTGVGKHIDQMFHGLAARPGVAFKTLAAIDEMDVLRASPRAHPLADLPLAVLPFPRRRMEWSWLLSGRPHVDQWTAGADWIYCPYEVNLRARHARVAVTIHSLFQFDPDRPGYKTIAARRLRLRYGHSFGKIMRQADLLLTVSEFIKRQMVDWYRVPPQRIVVVGNGVEEEFYRAGASAEEETSSAEPYVVCLSGLNEFDGAEAVVATARELLVRDPAIQIRVAGHQHEPNYLQAASSLPNIRLLGYVEKGALATLMRHSAALLFLNRYESFGIAAVEAMAAGTPVIGTRQTAVPEIMGDAGLMVDPAQPGEIAAAVIAFARTPSLRTSYVVAGKARAEQFRWSACVERLHRALAGGE